MEAWCFVHSTRQLSCECLFFILFFWFSTFCREKWVCAWKNQHRFCTEDKWCCSFSSRPDFNVRALCDFLFFFFFSAWFIWSRTRSQNCLPSTPQNYKTKFEYAVGPVRKDLGQKDNQALFLKNSGEIVFYTKTALCKKKTWVLFLFLLNRCNPYKQVLLYIYIYIYSPSCDTTVYVFAQCVILLQTCSQTLFKSARPSWITIRWDRPSRDMQEKKKEKSA